MLYSVSLTLELDFCCTVNDNIKWQTFALYRTTHLFALFRVFAEIKAAKGILDLRVQRLVWPYMRDRSFLSGGGEWWDLRGRGARKKYGF